MIYRSRIQAKELRIGNYVNINNHLGVRQVTIEAKDIYHIATNKLASSYFEPIPLTEEWLVKAGAKKADGFNYHLRLGATHLVLRIQGGKCYCELAGLYIGEIESVHRLQNLVFSLTSNELFFDL